MHMHAAIFFISQNIIFVVIVFLFTNNGIYNKIMHSYRECGYANSIKSKNIYNSKKENSYYGR